MSTGIPIQNIYYLLSYAWDQLRPGEEVNVDAQACPDIANLLSRVLTSGISRIARHGFERHYLEQTNEVSRLRGRVLVMPSYRKGLHLSGRMQCEFDELSFDTPANRALGATCRSLFRCSELTPENRAQVRHASALIPPVKAEHFNGASFKRIQLHRNTRNYRLVLDVCRLIHECLLPEEEAGTRRFIDILRKETVMHRLFERFVFHFAERHFPDARVSAMGIQWQATEISSSTEMLLPGMRTDVTMAWPETKLIIDCKYYPQALSSRSHGNFQSQGFHSSHLYQLHAYLTNKSFSAGWENVEGMLIYPTNGIELDHSFILHGKHRVRIKTLDLALPWKQIGERLKECLAPVDNPETHLPLAQE